jgi:hopene-associated glycosyltransferase HpnB
MAWIEIIAFAALAFWVCVTLDRSRSWPHEAILPGSPREPASIRTVSLAVIVPARNEAELLPATLTSLLVQQIDGVTVYLVDDGSSDDTAEVAREMSMEPGLAIDLEVVSAGPRPTGWSGKVHALEQGYQTILEDADRAGMEPPEWLLLTDADIHHRAGSLASLLLKAESNPCGERFDLVSVMARLRADGFWERLMVPAFVFFFQLLYPFRRVAMPDSRIAAAAGGCVLLRRSALERAGGMTAIRGAIIDDVALAKAVKDSGGGTWLGFDPGICSLRPYPRLVDLWQMVSRTAFTQLRYSGLLLILTLVGLTIFVVSPPIVIGWILTTLPLSLGLVSSSPGRALLWAALAWVLMSIALLPAIRYHRIPAIYSVSLPLSGSLFGLMTASSAWKHWRGRGSNWRGRMLDPP